MKRFSKLSVTLLAAVSLLTFAAPAFAEQGSGSGSSGSGTSGRSTSGTSTSKEAEVTSKSTETETEHTAAVAQAKASTTEAHDKACTTRKNAVTTIEKRVANRGQARLDAITKIATKVENYVQTNNLTVANYDSLIATVNAKKAAAQAALDTTKNDQGAVAGVTCQNGDGKVKVESFKKDMKAQQEALTAYRQSVKTLITAVKSVKAGTGGTQQ